MGQLISFTRFKLTLLKLALLFVCSTLSYAEQSNSRVRMSPEILHTIISSYAENVTVNNNLISFEYQKVPIYCIWDAKADRMRMISPIADLSDLTSELLELALKANYHTVLDARYAIGDGVLYSAFIHPLSPITQEEVESAIRQVATAALTFGSSFTSGELVFPGNSSDQVQKGKSPSL